MFRRSPLPKSSASGSASRIIPALRIASLPHSPTHFNLLLTVRPPPNGAAIAKSIFPFKLLLFASGIEDVKINRYSIKTIFSLCNQATFAGQLRVRNNSGYTYPVNATANIMRELFAGCLMHCKSWDAQMAFSLAMNLNIPQCLPRASELVQDQQTPCHVMQTVMIAIAMFGDKDDIAVLELRVDDGSFCGVTQKINNVQYRTQLRDVAIAAMLILAKEDPVLYGFPRIQVLPNGQFSYSRVGFANDEARGKTRAKWDTFRATLKIPRLDRK